MELLNQFQGFLGSIGFGFFFYLAFHLIYKIVKNHSFFIKFPVFLIIFLFNTYLYFNFLVRYTFGIMNIFYPLSIFLGVLFYNTFYFNDFNKFYNYKINKMQKLIKLKKDKWFAIISKKKRRKEHVKNIESKK